MATIEWSDLRGRVRDRADQESTQPTSALVTTAQLDKRLNESCSAYQNLIVSLQRHEWSLTKPMTHSLAVVDDQATYNLPPGCLCVVAVRASDGSYAEPVFPYDHSERWAYEGLNTRTGTRWGYKYRVEGPQIRILPAPASPVTTLEVEYIPEWSELVDGQSLDVPYGWWVWPMLHCAMGMLSKQDRDASSLMREWQIEDARIRSLATQRTRHALQIAAARDDLDDEDEWGFGKMWPNAGS